MTAKQAGGIEHGWALQPEESQGEMVERGVLACIANVETWITMLTRLEQHAILEAMEDRILRAFDAGRNASASNGGASEPVEGA